jgi:hypothetical protein
MQRIPSVVPTEDNNPATPRLHDDTENHMVFDNITKELITRSIGRVGIKNSELTKSDNEFKYTAAGELNRVTYHVVIEKKAGIRLLSVAFSIDSDGSSRQTTHVSDIIAAVSWLTKTISEKTELSGRGASGVVRVTRGYGNRDFMEDLEQGHIFRLTREEYEVIERVVDHVVDNFADRVAVRALDLMERRRRNR